MVILILVQPAGRIFLLRTKDTSTMNQDENDYHKKKRPRTKILTKIIDNIPEGYELHVPGKLIWQFFGEDLKKKFIRYGENTHLETDDDNKLDSTDS